MPDVPDSLAEPLERSPITRALFGILVPHADAVIEAIVGRFRRRRLSEWAAELNDDPDLTDEQMTSDDNLFAAFAVAGCVSRVHSRERVSYFARLYANFVAGRGITASEFAEFLHLLENLSDREFYVLLHLREMSRAVAAGVGGLGSNMLLYQCQDGWRRLRTRLASELGISEDQVNSIAQGLTRTGFCRVLPDRSGAAAAACTTAHFERFVESLMKYSRSAPPREPTISVRPYAG